MTGQHDLAELIDAVRRRGADLVAAATARADAELREASGLPGWDRLTILCHLRYATEAFARQTTGALAGEPVAFYPEGRVVQRPGTLRPRQDEAPTDVVASLAAAGATLDHRWARLSADEWATEVAEPLDKPDLGSVRLTDIALFRLTELEVHGTDLQIGLCDWSALFVQRALQFRVERMNRRRVEHSALDTTEAVSWQLAALDGPCYLVSAHHGAVSTLAATGAAAATIEGSSRDLLALLLGRPTKAPLRYLGDRDLGRSFPLAFPGP